MTSLPRFRGSFAGPFTCGEQLYRIFVVWWPVVVSLSPLFCSFLARTSCHFYRRNLACGLLRFVGSCLCSPVCCATFFLSTNRAFMVAVIFFFRFRTRAFIHGNTALSVFKFQRFCATNSLKILMARICDISMIHRVL